MHTLSSLGNLHIHHSTNNQFQFICWKATQWTTCVPCEAHLVLLKVKRDIALSALCMFESTGKLKEQQSCVPLLHVESQVVSSLPRHRSHRVWLMAESFTQKKTQQKQNNNNKKTTNNWSMEVKQFYKNLHKNLFREPSMQSGNKSSQNKAKWTSYS